MTYAKRMWLSAIAVLTALLILVVGYFVTRMFYQ